MSIRELWTVVFSPIILALCFFLGSAAGVASAVGLHAAGVESYYIVMAFSIAPVFVNIGSASLMSLLVYARTAQAKRRNVPLPRLVTAASTLTVYLSCLPVVAAIYVPMLLMAEIEAHYIWLAMLIVPFVYLAISDFFHFVTFRFITTTIWKRPHIYDPDDQSQLSEEELALSGPQPEPPVADNRVIRAIGKTSFDEAELYLLEAQGNYLRIVTASGESLERHKISAAVDGLSPNLGLFLHRSRWVGYAAISHVEKGLGQVTVILSSGEAISVASTRQKEVLKQLGQRRVPITLPVSDKPD